jgi:hypothetical protein
MATHAENSHTLGFDDVTMDVDAALGGRVTALRLGGRNLLTGPDVDPDNFGSTFWTSPQAAWGWPPVAEIDHLPYEVESGGPPGTLALRGPTSASLGVAVGKRFAVDAARGALRLGFAIHNHGRAPVKTAPWQISRVPPGGLTFFPTGDGSFPPSNLAVRQTPEVTWYAYDAAAVTDHQKLFADGREGWIAHVDGDALWIKTFAAVPRARQAPGEAQIEIYANPTHTYVEVEAQGAYDDIAPGAALDWEVTWLVRRLPGALPRGSGSAALVEHVRSLVAADARAAAG